MAQSGTHGVDEGGLEAWTPTGETQKAYPHHLRDPLMSALLRRPVVLDIGFRGAGGEARPVTPHAAGVDLDYPGYDGRTLPWADGAVDVVFSSHVLEHIDDPLGALRDWMRVLRIGGHVVCHVPHQFLYEKKAALPSRFNGDHKRFYTPARLLAEVEAALKPNTYRVRRLVDFDEGHDYALPPEAHSNWGYEIQLILEKIAAPEWAIA